MQPPGTDRRIRLLIVEDHAAVRLGIRGILQAADDIEIVGEAADGAQAVRLANQLAPNFILLDMELPVLPGDAVMRRVLETRPEVRVLVLSSYDDAEYIRGTMAIGARGYLLKDEAPALLLKAIRTIDGASSGAWLSPQAGRVLAAVPPSVAQELTWKELAIMQYLSERRPPPEIAARLNLSEAQLARHLHLLMLKFGAESLEALVSLSQRTSRPAS